MTNDMKNAVKQRKVQELGSFNYWTENYYGSKRNITTISWKGKGEVDANEIRQWCIDRFGKSGYREDIEDSYWVDNTEFGEIMLCKDEFLTAFLLRWT
jgi:hypothetical protein